MLSLNSQHTYTDILTHNEHKKVKILYFGAKWCGPCKILKPKIEKLGEDNERINIYYADIDICNNLSDKMNITSVPTVIILNKNKEFKTIVGNNFDEIISTLEKIQY